MEISDALEIVLDLARQNVLDATVTDPDLKDERARQQRALRVVEGMRNERAHGILMDVEALHRRYYTEWRRDDGSQGQTPFCKFCRTYQPGSFGESHQTGCERLAYLRYYYDVETQVHRKHPYLVARGAEFSRSGVYGWWTTKEEFKELADQAVAVERGECELKFLFPGIRSNREVEMLEPSDPLLVDQFDVDNAAGFDQVALDSGAYRAW
jgi:hypothetical protein